MGHRIGKVAKMTDEELELLASPEPARPIEFLSEIFSAMENLDAIRCHRFLALQFSVLGPSLFIRQLCVPLLHEIGERWARNEIGIAQERLVSNALRSILGSASLPTAHSLQGPLVVLAAPPGERHEFGLLMAALTVLAAGANPLYLGVDLPVEDIIAAVEDTGASALALSLINSSNHQTSPTIHALRSAIRAEVPLWVGGEAGSAIQLPPDTEFVGSYDDFEQKVGLLPFVGRSKTSRGEKL